MSTTPPDEALEPATRSAAARTAGGMARAAMLILALTIVARLAGFARYLVFGATVGGGDIGTAYTSANLLPTVLFEVAAGGALAAVVIPLISGLVERDDRADADRILSALTTWMLALTVPIAIVVALAAGPLAALILGGAGSEPAVVALGARLLRVFAIQVPLYGITVIVGAYLQARRRFLWPAAAPLVSSLVVMASYVAYSMLAPVVVDAATLDAGAEAVLGWGTTAGVAAMALVVLVPALRAGMRLRPVVRLERATARRALGLGIAGVGAIGAQQATLGLILLLAMRAGGTGTLPVFQYAQAVYLLPFAVLVMSVVTSVFPQLSEQRLTGDERGFAATALTSMRAVILISTAGAAALIAGAPSVEHFFRVVDRAGVSGVGSTVAALALGLAPYAITVHATRVLSAAHRAADALLVGSIGWGVAALLILVVTVLTPTRRAAEASTAFGLCIAVGMTVAAVVGLSRCAAATGADRAGATLARTSIAGIVALIGGGVAGYLLARPLTSSTLTVTPTVLVGLAGGALACAVAVVLMAAIDLPAARRAWGLVRSRVRRTKAAG